MIFKMLPSLSAKLAISGLFRPAIMCNSLKVRIGRPAAFCTSQDIHNITGVSSHCERSHTCGELCKSDEGKSVSLYGWLQYQRFGKFFTIRDSFGATQVLLPDNKESDMVKLIAGVNYESVLKVDGLVRIRPEGQENNNMRTGDIEIYATDITVLGHSQVAPFEMKDQTLKKVKESLRMEYRYLDLRSSWMQGNLRLRSRVIMKMRDYLCNKAGFVDVETPTLFRRTPGGAREFIVPTKQHGKFYSLPQSPQQFKQLLMVGGVDRYMQIARCYRDESNRPDRQPEFTQLDLEMSFINRSNVYELIEELLIHCWPDHLGDIETPFPRLKYKDALEKYGTDAPDISYGMQLSDVSDLLRDSGINMFQSLLRDVNYSAQAICVKNTAGVIGRKDIEQLQHISQSVFSKDVTVLRVAEGDKFQGRLSHLITDNTKRQLVSSLSAENGDYIIICVAAHSQACKVMGRMRLESYKLLRQKGVNIKRGREFSFVWVEDFPMFLPKEDGTGGLESAHHPFTAPHPDDIDTLETSPEKTRSLHYDLVLNGAEIGGGSIRVHNSTLQRYIIEHILKEDASQLEHLLKAFQYGCPPHGGIALGVDRLLAMMVDAPSIRDVIAFPKSEIRDQMCDSPSSVSDEDLRHYNIKLTEDPS